MIRRLHIVILSAQTILLLAILLPTSAEAQTPARSFEELENAVHVGIKITVTDAAGRRATGTLSDLSASSLALLVGGRSLRFGERDVALIQRHRFDSLVNGALIGAVVGVAPILAIEIAEEAGGEPCTGQCTGAFLMWAGIGAGIGTAVDAAIRDRKIIYVGQASHSSSLIVSLSPILWRGTKGLRFTRRF